MSENQDQKPGRPFGPEDGMNLLVKAAQLPEMREIIRLHKRTFKERIADYFNSIWKFFAGLLGALRRDKKN
jgi:hypothetical protein